MNTHKRGLAANRRELTSPAEIRQHLFSGYATISLIEEASGQRHTYLVWKGDAEWIYLVQAQTDEGAYLGHLNSQNLNMRTGKKGRSDHPCFAPFARLTWSLNLDQTPSGLTVWAE